ncbi:E3 ubiquitin-protein ligase At4g11680-like [Silene latifolia]|uniref:E3 ubiquitin-protein ligase At4g11680-like n=1 Tax=Silene latifolia TaxID=37657 RepID=UPI003D7708C4
MSTTVIDAASTPLLTSTGETSHRSRREVIRDETARFLHQVSGRQLLSEQSMRVRETVVQQLDERRSHWAYSTPIVILDLLWNTLLVLSAIIVMIASKNEVAEVPVRWWIVGYGIQCVVHMICVCVEYFRLRNLRNARVGSILSSNWSFGLGSGSDLNLNVESGSGFGLGSNLESNLNSSTYMSSSASDGVRADIIEFVTQRIQNEDDTSFAKKVESLITKSSFIWWIVGMYWFSSGGQKLADDAPMLYWLTAVFLVFDVLFVVMCVLVACTIGIAVCCFLPCIIAFLYTVSDQVGFLYFVFISYFPACERLQMCVVVLTNRKEQAKRKLRD